MLKQLERKQFLRLSAGLKELYLAAYQPLPQYAYSDPEQVASYLEWLYSGDPAGFVVACPDDQRRGLAGFAAVHGTWRLRDGRVVAELHELVVAPAAQGRGIGRALLDWAIEYAGKLRRPVLSLWVGEQNRRATQLYRRYGFEEVGRWGCWMRMERRIARTKGAAPVSSSRPSRGGSSLQRSSRHGVSAGEWRWRDDLAL